MTVRKSVLKKLSALTAGGTLLFGMMLSSHSQSIDKPDTPFKVALVLDCVTQPRFQEDLKNFGMERMLPLAGGHLAAGQLLLPTQKDRDLFKIAENAHRDFLIGFVHCAPVPGRGGGFTGAGGGFSGPGGSRVATSRPERSTGKAEPGRLTTDPLPADSSVSISPVCNRLRHLSMDQGKMDQGKMDQGKMDQGKAAAAEQANLYQEMSKAAQKALPTLMKGKGAEQEVGDWLIVTRPVRALKTSCLKCHTSAKLGDTLGALAYVVSKKTFAVALPPSGAAPTDKGGF